MRIQFLYLLVILMAGCGRSGRPTDIEEERLHGKVRAVTEYYFEASQFGERVSKGKLLSQSLQKYNEKGYKTDFYMANLNTDSLIWEKRARNHFDEDGIPLLVSEDEHGKYKYDDNGNRIEAEYSGLNGKYYTTYNENNQMIAEELRSPDSLKGIAGFNEYKYNEDGLLEEILQKNSRHKLELRIVHKYDELQNLIEQIEYDVQGKRYQSYEYYYESYDKNGNWTKRVESSNGDAKRIVKRHIEYYE
ncbi:MAG: hypothetical protein ACKOXB_04315 [Flavobacteriales bacterium]